MSGSFFVRSAAAPAGDLPLLVFVHRSKPAIGSILLSHSPFSFEFFEIERLVRL
jgi:hypothetical protein